MSKNKTKLTIETKWEDLHKMDSIGDELLSADQKIAFTVARNIDPQQFYFSTILLTGGNADELMAKFSKSSGIAQYLFENYFENTKKLVEQSEASEETTEETE